jgi:hypothetical protein
VRIQTEMNPSVAGMTFDSLPLTIFSCGPQDFDWSDPEVSATIPDDCSVRMALSETQ